jgi:superfamily II DNA or RNA helicase
MATTLRPYQARAEADIFAAWKNGARSVMFQLCTGGGKTVLFVEIIKKFILAKKRVILVAHREELITQAWQTLYKNSIYSGIIKGDVKTNYALPCQVASIQTLARRKNLPAADLVIFDEAHHSQDENSYGNLLIDHYQNARLLGVTATPYRLNGKGFTGMYNELITGPSYKDLVAMGYLTPIRYFASFVPDLSKARVEKGDYVTEDAAKAMSLAPIVESYLEHCSGLCGLVFAVNIAHSNQIVNQYLAAGIKAAHVDADTPAEERRLIFKKLAARELQIVSNVGIATEGTDIPNVDFVQLARPTKSLALFLQMIGRGTRTLHDAIKDARTDEERAAMVLASSKPFCYVLDNAALWKEHGLPDQGFNWRRYFTGTESTKKKKDLEIIEILEYVAEDQDGRVIRSKTPKEVEGLKLIEVNKIEAERERIINLSSLERVDKELAQLVNIPHIKKPGFVAYNNYKTLCYRQGLFMAPEVWEYLFTKLSREPAELIEIKLKDLERRCDIARQSYPHNPGEAERLIKAATAETERALVKARKTLVPEGFLRKERAEYLSKNVLKAQKSA